MPARKSTVRADHLVCTLRSVNRATLARQMLLAREAISVPAAIERLAGMQAQLARAPFVGLWTRLSDFAREDLAKRIHTREIVRATFLRGTLHLVTAKDFVAFRGALQPGLTDAMKAILRERADRLDVTAAVDEARRFFAAEPRTFEDLRDAFAAADPKSDARAMAFAVRTHLPLVQVPNDTLWSYPSAPAFAVADAWLGKLGKLGNAGKENKRIADGKDDKAAEALVQRYLAAFGPASASDVQTWSGQKGLKGVLEALRPKLVTLVDERGRELYDLPEAPRPEEDTAAPPRFLPEFDNLLLSHANRRRVLADIHRASVFLPGLRVRSTILVDGFVAGTWKIDRLKAKATLVVEPFVALAKKVRDALEEEGGKLTRFTDGDANAHEVKFAKI